MSASLDAYKKLIEEFYAIKVRQCQRPYAGQQCLGMNLDCVCTKQFHELCRVVQTNVPFKFRYASTDKLTIDEDAGSRKIVEKYIFNFETMKQKGFGMWISGAQYSGKSLLVCSVIVAAARNGFSAYYIDLDEFYRLQELRYSDESDKSQRYQRTIKKLQNIDFLAIDGIGFGIQGGKPASKQALANLFRDRASASKPTIIGSLAIASANPNNQEFNLPQELMMISPEFYSMVKGACPVIIGLQGSQEYMENELKEKRDIFENLPGPK